MLTCKYVIPIKALMTLFTLKKNCAPEKGDKGYLNMKE